MSCTLINGRTNPCNTISGIKRVYLFKYVQYLDTQIVCVPGSELISFPESNIYAFECVNATSDETITNDDNGVEQRNKISDFMSPGYLTPSLGIEYSIKDVFTTSLSP